MESDIQIEFNSLQQTQEIFIESNFVGRLEAIDLLEFNVIDRLACAIEQGNDLKILSLLMADAEILKQQLVQIDEKLFQKLRLQIQNSPHPQFTFIQILDLFFPLSRSCFPSGEKMGYDSLDVFVNGLLNIHPIPMATKVREPGMVYFQKTPVRIILEMISKAAFTPKDIFCDLGSGLGQVSMLVGLLSYAKSWGVEIDVAYCAYAQTTATALNLQGVKFIQSDARKIEYTMVSVCFLYSSFEGCVLEHFLEKLKSKSNHKLKLFTYGPCTKIIAQQPWLNQVQPSENGDHQLAHFEKRY